MSARSETFIEIAKNSEGFLFSEKGLLKFSPNRKLLFAACVDGLIYKFDYDSSSNCLKNLIDCSMKILPSNEHLGMISVSNSGDVAFASETNELVRLYKMGEDGKFADFKLVTKSAGATNALALNPSGTILCCSATDNIVKVINVKDSQDFQILNQIPSTHFVKSIAFSENGNLLSLLQVDGILRIFKIVENNPAPQLIKTLTGPHGIDKEGKFELNWKGNLLGVLYGGGHLRIYDSENWSIKSEISIKKCLNFDFISTEAALLTFFNGEISIYSIERNQIIAKQNYEGNSDNFSIAVADEKFACLIDSEYYNVTLQIHPKDLIKPEDKKMKLAKLNKKDNKKKEFKKSKFISDEAEGDTDEEDEEEEEGEDGFNESDEEDVEGENLEGLSDRSNGELSDREGLSDEEGEYLEGSEGEEINGEAPTSKRNFTSAYTRKLHPIVQPCCTPWRNLQRYLAYNNVGYITARRDIEEKESFNYDIEFMDRSAHQPVRFTNEISFKVAALSEKGAVFASDGVGACLHYVPFENPSEIWNVPLPIGSEPILIGINSLNIFLVNSRGTLNIYSLSGLLQSSSTCPGRPISLVCPDGNVIYMFTEDSEGVLCYKLSSKNGGVVGNASRVILGSENNLIWCGLSFSGVLGAFTTKGKFLIQLTRETERWSEILDTSRTLSDKFEQAWPVYFDVNTLSGIVCKQSAAGFPDPYPAPHVIDFNFRIPEIGDDPISTTYEEVLRTGWVLNETCNNSNNSLTEREKKKLFATSDRHLLELAQLSLKTNRIDRLTDLARWCSNEKTVELLIQLAKHHKLVAIVEELESIKVNLFHKIEPKKEEPIVSRLSVTNPTVIATPKLNEIVVKESPSGILANLTPLKQQPVINEIINTEAVSSPAEIASSPSNPFAMAKENSQTEEGGNAMLDYISAMMNLNNSGKRKGEEIGNNSKKSNNSSALSK